MAVILTVFGMKIVNAVKIVISDNSDIFIKKRRLLPSFSC